MKQISIIAALWITLFLNSCDGTFPELLRPDDPENYSRVSLDYIRVENLTGSIIVSWIPPTDPLFEFIQIECFDNGTPVGSSTLLSKYTTTYTFTGLNNYTLYDLVIKTMDAASRTINTESIAGCPHNGIFDNTQFPNSNLRSYVQTNITETQIAEMTDFTLSGSGTTDLNGLQQLTSLINLDVINEGSLSGISYIRSCQKLTSLNISGSAITDISSLQYLRNIVKVDLTNNPNLNNTSGLEGLQYLTSLNLSGNTILTDISALGTLENLRVLDLSGNTALTDLSPIAHLENLQILDITGCTGIPLEQVAALMARMNLLVLY